MNYYKLEVEIGPYYFRTKKSLEQVREILIDNKVLYLYLYSDSNKLGVDFEDILPVIIRKHSQTQKETKTNMSSNNPNKDFYDSLVLICQGIQLYEDSVKPIISESEYKQMNQFLHDLRTELLNLDYKISSNMKWMRENIKSENKNHDRK